MMMYHDPINQLAGFTAPFITGEGPRLGVPW